jgi:hypothetical protein
MDKMGRASKTYGDNRKGNLLHGPEAFLKN